MQSIKRTPLLIAVLLLVLATACAPAPTLAPTAVPPTPTSLQLATSAPATVAPTSAAPSATNAEVTGAALYQLSCAACHAQDRSGNNFKMDGQTISVPPLAWDDLNKMYQTQPSRGTVQQQLTLAITQGQSETGEDFNAMMPRWSSLSQTQVDSLIQYIQTASTTTGGVPTLTPAATDLMGEQLYQTACAACHAQDGTGNSFKMNGQTVSVPALEWADLNKMYQTQPSRGTVQQQLTMAITKGQSETGEDFNPMMPRWSFLSQVQVDSLIQYIQTTFK
jgi:cytochrome c